MVYVIGVLVLLVVVIVAHRQYQYRAELKPLLRAINGLRAAADIVVERRPAAQNHPALVANASRFDAMSGELEAAGCIMLGDLEELKPDGSVAGVTRWFHDASHTTFGWFSVLTTSAGDTMPIVIFFTECEPTHFVVTNHGGSPLVLAPPPTLHRVFPDSESSLADALATHHIAVAAVENATPIPIDDIAAATASLDRMRDHNASWRANQPRAALLELDLCTVLTTQRDDLGQAHFELVYPRLQSKIPPTGSGPGDPNAGAHALFSKALVFHSQTPSGRHLLTTLNVPPLLIGPVAANHCRAGSFLLQLVTHTLPSRDPRNDCLTITRENLPPDLTPPTGFPEVHDSIGSATVRLVLQRAPVIEGLETDPDPDTQFLTVLPPEDYPDEFDAWLVRVARDLGLDVGAAQPAETYHSVLADAVREVQRRLPKIRERFRTGFDGHTLAFKVGLTTTDGGTEYVWLSALSWDEDETVTGRLENAPHDCPGYTEGQTLPILTRDVVDYMIGGDEGLLDPGLTQRLAQDYGLTV